MNRTLFVYRGGRARAGLRVAWYRLSSAVSARSPAVERRLDRRRAHLLRKRWMRAEQWRTAHPDGLEHSEARVTSQNGEDGILQAIFERVGTTNQVFVEVGSG